MSVPVLFNDDGIRPAGEKGACFYCCSKVGNNHKPGCVAVHKKVIVQYTFNIELEVPSSWDKESIDSHMNNSSWCANNAISTLSLFSESVDCLCSFFKGETIDPKMDAIPYAKIAESNPEPSLAAAGDKSP